MPKSKIGRAKLIHNSYKNTQLIFPELPKDFHKVLPKTFDGNIKQFIVGQVIVQFVILSKVIL